MIIKYIAKSHFQIGRVNESQTFDISSFSAQWLVAVRHNNRIIEKWEDEA